MEPKRRNALATVCLNYVRSKEPNTFNILKHLVENNYPGGIQRYSPMGVIYECKRIQAAEVAQAE